jgi:hypothetical protein
LLTCSQEGGLSLTQIQITSGLECSTKYRTDRSEYYSKTLNKAERNYCVTCRELPATVRTLAHFCKYLYEQEFRLRTEHSALIWLMNFKNPEGQSARWIQHLQEYNFTSEHHQGWKQQCRCPFVKTMPRGVYLLPQNRGAGRYQAHTSYYSCSSSSRLGSRQSQNKTERPGNRAYLLLTAAPRTIPTEPNSNP